MAIAHNSTLFLGNGTGNLSALYTPPSTPRGVLVGVVQDSGTTNELTSVTYGAAAMAPVALSPLVHANGTEDGVVYYYFLGSSIPTGAQTVTVNVNGTGSVKAARVWTVTAAADTEVVDTKTLDSASTATPSVTLVTPAGVETYIVAALHTGESAGGNVDADVGYTEENVFDFGVAVCQFVRRSAIATGGNITVGWTLTAGAEEAGVLAVAIREVSGSNTSPDTPNGIVGARATTTTVLNGDAFADDDVGDLHAASDWEVDVTAGDFSSPVFQSLDDATNKTTITATGLSAGTAYKFRVRYKDDSGDAGTQWSSWSTAVDFATLHEGITLPESIEIVFDVGTALAGLVRRGKSGSVGINSGLSIGL